MSKWGKWWYYEKNNYKEVKYDKCHSLYYVSDENSIEIINHSKFKNHKYVTYFDNDRILKKGHYIYNDKDSLFYKDNLWIYYDNLDQIDFIELYDENKKLNLGKKRIERFK